MDAATSSGGGSANDSSRTRTPPRAPTTSSAPRTPQSAHALRTLMLPTHSRSRSMTPGYPRTPLTSQPASSSLAALLETKPPRHPRTPATSGDSEERWRKVCARILPLFNGEHVHGPVEETSEAVRALLVARGDEEAWREIDRLVRVGMASVVRRVYGACGVAPMFDGSALLSVRGLGGAPDGVVLDALAGVWGSLVYPHVLPYLEAVFLPLRVYCRVTAGARCVRATVLACFRDCVVVPLLPQVERAVGGVGMAGEGRWLATVASAAQMLATLAALTPDDRGPLYASARALAAAQYC
ncbi:hypothetical protein IW150_002083 [Coemansia sp. RSA 2607]|nr:hypothetical protein IW150_002083 [Coemansia sp. RSA 2607]